MSSKWKYEDIYLDLSEKGLGMSIRGGKDSPDSHGNVDIYVSRILDRGAVSKDNRIQIGDILLEVNGTSLLNIEHKKAADLIIEAGPYIHFKIKKKIPELIDNENSESEEDQPLLIEKERNEEILFGYEKNDLNLIKVELFRKENSFGFTLEEKYDNNISKIYVNNIVENGAAHLSGQIQKGDQIIAINGTNLENVSLIWAVDYIRQNPSKSVFTVLKKINWDS